MSFRELLFGAVLFSIIQGAIMTAVWKASERWRMPETVVALGKVKQWDSVVEPATPRGKIMEARQ